MGNYSESKKEIITSDGKKLVSRFYEPDGENNGSILIVPAMGTTQNFYYAFAKWLAMQGFTVVTFDYRGTGLSYSGSLRGYKANILDWASLDCAAMIDSISRHTPGKPLYWIGHSLGGQIIPFVPNCNMISKFITIASGSGYWRENTASLKYRVIWLWYVAVPLATMIFDYFPGKKLHKVGNLPKGVMLQWRTWCLNPGYASGVVPNARNLYASIRVAITSFSFTDDEFMSATSIQSLHDLYINSEKKMLRIDPQDCDVKRIGHFGFFKPIFENTLWVDVIRELRSNA